MRTLLLLSYFRLILGTGLLLSVPASAVSIDWVPIGNPGNPADTAVMSDGTTGYGSVPYVYQIGKYDVTNAQYAEFLNSVAKADPNALYNMNMGIVSNNGGINRTGGSGSYSYNAIAGRENLPVNYVTFYDSLRFANWMENGQPTGAQGAGTTETGAYTITAQGIANNSITRNPGATIFLPSEDEWYKAAYYNALTTSYFGYPAGSNTQPTCAAPSAAPNTANCYQPVNGVNDVTPVGSYTGSASPYGTFDQGGNVFQWNEAIFSGTAGINGNRGPSRGVRGGGFFNDALYLASSVRDYDNIGLSNYGFRMASIPEPSTGLLVIAGLLGLTGWHRARA